MQKMRCALCGRDEKPQLLYPESINFERISKETFSARRIPEKVHYRLMRCQRCTLIYSSPILTEDKIKLLYKQSKLTYAEEIPSLKKTYGDYLSKTLPFVNKNPHLLEIGGGNGFFLEKALELGVTKVNGIEPSRSAINAARSDIKKKLIADFFPSEKIKPSSYDIICIFQTLDHVTDPNRFLRACHTALRKNGVVLCILHDTEGLSVKILGEHSPIFDIEHIYLFNKKTLQLIFEKNNFTPLVTFSVVNTFPLRYWIRMFPFPSIIKPLFLSLLQNIHLDNLPLSMRAGNIGIIARKS
ncbi:class I SAM-dependent methyltransferase [Candidatus Gottesmanbacteria bacterium]|nr:class I SAM-dependent methyltransferase [Candidatus Gottesmanbacteria bacterium]